MGRFTHWSTWNNWPVLRLFYHYVIGPWRETKVLMSLYLGWMLLVLSMICECNSTLVITAEFYLHLYGAYQLCMDLIRVSRLLDSDGLRTKKTKTRKRRQRKPPDPWFNRAKRRRYRKRMLLRVSKKSSWQWDGTEKEWMADIQETFSYRSLHRSGYQHHFQRTCDLVPGFDLLLRNDSVFDHSFSPHRSRFARYDWGLLSLDQDFDRSHVGQDQTTDVFQDITDCFQLQSVYSCDEDDLPLIFDTGASVSVTPRRSDFISFNSDIAGNFLRGLSERAEVKGVGTVAWKVRDDQGRVHEIKTRAFWVPKADVRLLSPQVYFRQPENMSKGGLFKIDQDGSAVFIFPNTRAKLSFHICDHTRLPVAYVASKYKKRQMDGFNVLDSKGTFTLAFQVRSFQSFLDTAFNSYTKR